MSAFSTGIPSFKTFLTAFTHSNLYKKIFFLYSVSAYDQILNISTNDIAASVQSGNIACKEFMEAERLRNAAGKLTLNSPRRTANEASI